MRASDTTYVAEEVEAFLSRENKSGSGLCSPRLLFFLQSCTLCVFLSISALAPFSGGSSTNRSDFSGSAVQHGLQFSLDECSRTAGRPCSRALCQDNRGCPVKGIELTGTGFVPLSLGAMAWPSAASTNSPPATRSRRFAPLAVEMLLQAERPLPLQAA